MDLDECRSRIDELDGELRRLFNERLDLAASIAEAKRGMGKAVFDPDRERRKLLGIANATEPGRRAQMTALFSLLMSMNKAEQQRVLAHGDPTSPSARARAAWLPVETAFPSTATVACQGVEGAYSQIAACRLYNIPGITYFETFEGVFRAVAEGYTEFGVLPIENSTAGSVNAVYDLLGAYGCHIVRSLRLKIDHNLMALPGTRIADVREVYSHEQALAQCAGYLERMSAAPVVCENTAMAAETVASSGRTDVAALASRSSAELYGLEILDSAVQDSDNNYTRFIVITREPRVYPGATKTSLMLTVKHVPGALYRVLERFYALDINLVKLESRPIPGRDFQFAFYFDLECPVGAPAFSTLLDSLGDVCEHLEYFGSYQEIV